MSDFPDRRPRRNRQSDPMRRLMRETTLTPDDLIQPLFVKEGVDRPEPIESLPGVHHHSPETVVEQAREVEETGVPAILLFGVPEEDSKDPEGTPALREDAVVARALRNLRSETDDLLLITDVCIDPYTDHGHCGVVEDRRVVNDPTLPLLADMAELHARAGAHMVAPSDMMDGRVQAIRSRLDEAEHSTTAIMSYAVKYASAFYGPFREAAEAGPEFGDRATYQMDPPNRREARLEAEQDTREGADWLMVKPALPYLDVVRDVREQSDLPLAAYCVSGEMAMVESAARDGLLDRKATILETLASIKRAGADAILTYWAREAAGWLS